MQEVWLKSQSKIGKEIYALKRKYRDNQEPQKEYGKRKYKEKPELKLIEMSENEKRRKQRLNQQIRQGPYYICAVCHCCLY